MKINVSCDMEKDFNHRANIGTDITIKTKSEHEIVLSVREHGVRLTIDGKERNDIDFKFKV